ncbi:MAG: glycoside hydrolase family 71/99 protein, partial [Candidatus Xenobia bacterium]
PHACLTLATTKPSVSIVSPSHHLVIWPLLPERYNVALGLSRLWEQLVDHTHLTQSPAYLKVNGKPLLEIWGFGFTNRRVGPAQALSVIRWFTHDAPTKYQVTLMGGVPRYWRTLDHDARSDPAWTAVYRSFNIVSPWRAGNYDDSEAARQAIRTVAAGDVAAVLATGQGYMPVIFPGFSSQCWPDHCNDPSLKCLNSAPRMGGRFMWTQACEFARLGVQTMYVGMFDEMNEGTAILKLAPTQATTPTGCHIVALDADGLRLPSDWYLQVTHAVSVGLKTQRLSSTPNLPLHPPSSGP